MSKPKAVNYEVIDRERNPKIYEMLDDVRDSFHGPLEDAKIALAWRKRQKADKDGHMLLGKCVKVSDLQRQLHNFDFIIVLNQDVWNDPEFDVKKKRALLDHELCHAAPSLDGDGNQREDEQERKVWRMRRHDIEEFRCIVERHGCYKADLKAFAESLRKKKSDGGLFQSPASAEARPN